MTAIVEASASVHLSLDGFKPANLALDLATAPACVDVARTAEMSFFNPEAEPDQGAETRLRRIPDPVQHPDGVVAEQGLTKSPAPAPHQTGFRAVRRES